MAEIVNLIVETVMCKNDKILIASNWYPASLVKKKFLMLTYSHIEYCPYDAMGDYSMFRKEQTENESEDAHIN